MFDPLAVLHDEHAIRHFGDHAHVMGDQHDGCAEFALQLAHQFECLRLNGHVKSCGRFIGDHQLWLARKCHGDHDALAHTAGKFVRILAEPPCWFTHMNSVQHLPCDCFGRLLTSGVMLANNLSHLRPDGHDGV